LKHSEDVRKIEAYHHVTAEGNLNHEYLKTHECFTTAGYLPHTNSSLAGQEIPPPTMKPEGSLPFSKRVATVIILSQPINTHTIYKR
jgi:hypothetical protein